MLRDPGESAMPIYELKDNCIEALKGKRPTPSPGKALTASASIASRT